EAVVGEPLRLEVGSERLAHPREVRAAVRVHQDGELSIRLAAIGEEERRAERSLAELEELGLRRDHRALGDARDLADALASPDDANDRQDVLERRRSKDGGAAA